MKKLDPTMAQQVAQAISVFQEQRTGCLPKAVTVVLSEDTLVVTLREALSPAEKALASAPEGAAQVQEFHRQLFMSSVDTLREEIKRITGIAVAKPPPKWRRRPAPLCMPHAAQACSAIVCVLFGSGNIIPLPKLARRISRACKSLGAIQNPTRSGLPGH